MPFDTARSGRTRFFSPAGLLGCILTLAVVFTGTAWTHGGDFFRTVERIDTIIRQSQTQASDWGIYVQDAISGQPLYALYGDGGRVPASTQKLLTAATALDVLGRDFRYETKLHFTGTIDGGVMRGDLILEGSGDPTLGSREMDTTDPLRAWADELAARGITRFEGRIIGEDGRFDGVRYPASWDENHIRDKSYAPATSALSYKDNMIELAFTAPRTGEPVQIRTIPADYMDIRNSTRTNSSRARRRITFDRALYSETLYYGGSVPRGYRAQRRLPVYDPTAFTVHSFNSVLEEAGIRTAVQLLTTDDLLDELPLEKTQLLFTHASPPLWEILQVMNKESDNLYAEQIFRTFSPDGSLEGSAGQVMGLMERAGVPPGSAVIRDGSGLSRANLVTPEAMAQVLTFMYHHPEGEAFLATLPYGGEASTTLKNRLSGVPVQAKTGTLRSVRTLSGFATAADGRLVSFAIFANNFNASSRHVTRTIDAIVQTLTSDDAG